MTPGSDFEVNGSIALYALAIVSIEILSGTTKPKVADLTKEVINGIGLPVLTATISTLVPNH